MICARTLSIIGRRLIAPSSAVVSGNNGSKYTNTALETQRRSITTDTLDHPEGTVFKGEDFYGNKYYEAPRGDRGRYLKVKRWMEPAEAEDVSDKDFDKLPWKEQVQIVELRQNAAIVDVPPEWESWLRGRRPQTPSLQEQARSARVALKAKGLFPEGETAASSAAPSAASVHSTGKTADEVRKESVTGLSFPVYEEMEVAAGEELTPEERQRRLRFAKDAIEGRREDGDEEYVPPGARK